MLTPRGALAAGRSGRLCMVDSPNTVVMEKQDGLEVHMRLSRTKVVPLMYSDEALRAMYAGGRGNSTARRFARVWAWVFGRGIAPKRWVTLEVPGRRSGKVTRFPIGLAYFDGRTYAASMLGESCNWVKNLRAAEGRAVLRHGRAKECLLVEVPVEERAPILKSYVEQVPGARPHIPVDRGEPVSEFERIAVTIPVFLVTYSK